MLHYLNTLGYTIIISGGLYCARTTYMRTRTMRTTNTMRTHTYTSMVRTMVTPAPYDWAQEGPTPEDKAYAECMYMGLTSGWGSTNPRAMGLTKGDINIVPDAVLMATYPGYTKALLSEDMVDAMQQTPHMGICDYLAKAENTYKNML